MRVKTLLPEAYKEVEGPSGALVGMLCTAFSGFFVGVGLAVACFIVFF